MPWEPLLYGISSWYAFEWVSDGIDVPSISSKDIALLSIVVHNWGSRMLYILNRLLFSLNTIFVMDMHKNALSMMWLMKINGLTINGQESEFQLSSAPPPGKRSKTTVWWKARHESRFRLSQCLHFWNLHDSHQREQDTGAMSPAMPPLKKPPPTAAVLLGARGHD